MEDGVQVQQDQPFWSQPLTLEGKAFFVNLAVGTTFATVGNYPAALAAGLNVLKSIGLKKTNEQLAGALLTRAMHSAIHELLKGHVQGCSKPINNETHQFCAELDKSLSNQQINLNQDFLEKPGENDFVKLFQSKLNAWLTHLTEHTNPLSISARLPEYFVWALHREFQQGKTHYTPLINCIKTPISEAWQRTRTWIRYNVEFTKKLAEPVFDERFSLPQIYIWPRAYYVDEPLRNSSEPHNNSTAEIFKNVVDLKRALDSWIFSDGVAPEEQRLDSIRILSGDPGSGKSSFARMYALHLIKKGFKVLFVPLHRLNVQAEFGIELDTFCEEHDDHPTGLLKSDSAPPRLLLILDGLDELSNQGKIGATIASSFVEEIIRKLNNRNSNKLRVQALLVGRPIAIQNIINKFRKNEQVLYLLPYNIENTKECNGLTSLIRENQCSTWWRKYGKLVGIDYSSGVPSELSTLPELTNQPLLNYLLSLVFHTEMDKPEKDRKIDFQSSNINQNSIYHALVSDVHARDWDSSKSHRAIGDLREGEFRGLLEEMALAAWHGQERTTTSKALWNQCKGSSLENVLKVYEECSTEGISSLFTAFYFRKSDQVIGPEPTFEFTHYSFSEYLVASLIVNSISDLHTALIGPGNRMSAMTTSLALNKWLGLCGSTAISTDLKKWIVNEIEFRQLSNSSCSQIQSTILKILNLALREGVPCEQLPENLSFKEMTGLARNTEESLLILHSAFGGHTKITGTPNWVEENEAGSLIKRIQGQRTNSENCTGMLSLNDLDFSKQCLYLCDFYGANLRRSNFEFSHLNFANLDKATLIEANFRNAKLIEASLQSSQLSEADFSGATLARANFSLSTVINTNFSSAFLQGTNFEHVFVIEEADFSNAIFSLDTKWPADFDFRKCGAFGPECDFSGAELEGLELEDVQLMNANFEGSNLTNAKFSKVDLSAANLFRAKLGNIKWKLTQYSLGTKWPDDFDFKKCGALGPECNLAGAIIEGGHFVDIQLQNANFEAAELTECALVSGNCKNVNFRGAKLQSSRISACDFTGAIFENATIRQTTITRADFNGANLRGAACYSVHFYMCVFTEAILEKTNLSDSDFRTSNFSRANLKNSDLSGSSFFASNFREADLRGADLRGADLRRADLESSNLSGVILAGADLSEVNLCGALGLTDKQLAQCRSLKRIKGLDPKILKSLREMVPEKI